MAKHIYKVMIDPATKSPYNVGAVAFKGKTYAVKNGMVTIEGEEALPHPDAHKLKHIATEGDQGTTYIGDMARAHQAVVEAENAEKTARELLADAEKGKNEGAIKEARELVNTASAAVKEAKEKAAAAGK